MSTGQERGGPARADTGPVYPIRLDTPYRHAGHHTETAAGREARLADAAACRGTGLTAVQLAAGGSWRLAPAGPGDRDRETRCTERGASRRRGFCAAGRQAGPEAGG
jgi:hypothetical protein